MDKAQASGRLDEAFFEAAFDLTPDKREALARMPDLSDAHRTALLSSVGWQGTAALLRQRGFVQTKPRRGRPLTSLTGMGDDFCRWIALHVALEQRDAALDSVDDEDVLTFALEAGRVPVPLEVAGTGLVGEDAARVWRTVHEPSDSYDLQLGDVLGSLSRSVIARRLVLAGPDGSSVGARLTAVLTGVPPARDGAFEVRVTVDDVRNAVMYDLTSGRQVAEGESLSRIFRSLSVGPVELVSSLLLMQGVLMMPSAENRGGRKAEKLALEH